MHLTPRPMEEVKKLIRWKAQTRNVSQGLNNSKINEWLKAKVIIGKGEENEIEINEYWKQFYYLLLYFIVSKKTADKEALKKVADLITDPYKKYLDADDLKIMPKSTQQDLFGNITGNASYADYSHVTRKLNSLETLCSE